MTTQFQRELEKYGPDSARQSIRVGQAFDYCKRLARSHYENFSVVSFLVPRRLRSHFHSVYAFCRWADDLADEVPDWQQSLAYLDWWEGELAQCFEGEPRHPVLIALRETVRQFRIPKEPFRDLIDAFRQDQRVFRYESHAQVLEYCRRSANPVGRIVLYLGSQFSTENATLSDKICTGLQLANFCQDVGIDVAKGRIYLPRDAWDRFGCREEDLLARRLTEPFREMLRSEVDRAQQYLEEGFPLVERLKPPLAGHVALFAQGGLAILDAIRRAHFDVFSRRPKVSRLTKISLILRRLLPGSGGSRKSTIRAAHSPEAPS